MREAMAHAEVGDDVYGEDPTVNRLEEVAAEQLGKAKALFVASGTMANQLAIRARTQPGDAMFAGKESHVYLYESGGAAAISGVHSVLIGKGGFFDVDQLRDALYPRDDHYAEPRLVCAENTHNQSGGRVFPLEQQHAISEFARTKGLFLHLDGARLFNAAVASGHSARKLADPFDSVAFCLSKGLGAPVGSLICGDEDFIARARRFRKMFGGGMRQAGVLAAAGLYALENNIDRLADDHAQASALAEGLATIDGTDLLLEPETNIVLFDVADTEEFVAGAKENGVLLSAIGKQTIRAVTHLDISREDIDEALDGIRRALAG
jgi:threonine aldolase